MEQHAARPMSRFTLSPSVQFGLQVNTGQLRAILLLVFIILIGLFSVYSLSFSLIPDSDNLQNLELTAALLSSIAAVMALIKYYTRHDDKYLFIGTALLASGILKGIQSIPPDTLQFMSDRILFLNSAESWGVSRFIAGIFFSASLIPWLYSVYLEKRHILSGITVKSIYIFCVSLSIIVVCLLPVWEITSLEVYASTLLTFSLIGYILKGLWKQKYFEYFLVLALLIAIIAGFIYTASLQRYSDLYSLAQLFETVNYFLIVIGLLMSMYVAYKEVEDAKDNTDAILRCIGDGVFVVNNQGIVVLMNRIAEHLSGMSATLAIGRHYRDVFHFSYEENPHKPFPAIVERVLSRQSYEEDTTNHPVVHGRHGATPVLMSASLIKDHYGKSLGCVVVMLDMSKLREIERSKDNFLSLAAHQLGTPLGAVRWYTQMLLSGDAGKINAQVKTMLSQIEENNQRMVDLVNKLLDVSRIDQKSIQENPKKVSLEKVIKESIHGLKTHTFPKHISMMFTPPSQTTPITIDPDMIREVITNLLANGIKYNKQNGKVIITLTEEKDELVISIADTGIGIPKADQDKIYSKFFRATNARTKVPDGTGLGLFVAKSYIEGWGGRIEFESKEQEGTTFTMYIPKKPTLYTLSTHLAALDQQPSHPS